MQKRDQERKKPFHIQPIIISLISIRKFTKQNPDWFKIGNSIPLWCPTAAAVALTGTKKMCAEGRGSRQITLDMLEPSSKL